MFRVKTVNVRAPHLVPILWSGFGLGHADRCPSIGRRQRTSGPSGLPWIVAVWLTTQPAPKRRHEQSLFGVPARGTRPNWRATLWLPDAHIPAQFPYTWLPLLWRRVPTYKKSRNRSGRSLIERYLEVSLLVTCDEAMLLTAWGILCGCAELGLAFPSTYIQYAKIRVASDTVPVVLPLFPPPRPLATSL